MKDTFDLFFFALSENHPALKRVSLGEGPPEERSEGTSTSSGVPSTAGNVPQEEDRLQTIDCFIRRSVGRDEESTVRLCTRPPAPGNTIRVPLGEITASDIK